MGHSNRIHIAGALAAAFWLSACGQDKADPTICLTPISFDKAQPGDWQSCVHRWGYRLAGAPGSNKEIAEAVAAGCEEAVVAAVDAPSTAAAIAVAGDRDFALADLRRRAREQALFHVVQGRAGKCQTQ